MKINTKFSIKAESVTKYLVIIMLVLIGLHLIAMQIYFNQELGFREKFDMQYWHVSIFDLDEEAGIGTWFSSIILLISSILLFIKARILTKQKDEYKVFWYLLSIGFFILSIDEVVGIHEWFNSYLEGSSSTLPWTSYAVILVGIVSLFYIPFLWKYGKQTGINFFIAASIYIGGAVGVEHFSGDDVESLTYNMTTALEEGLEMLGIIVLIYALLDNLRGKNNKDFEVNVDIESEKEVNYLNTK